MVKITRILVWKEEADLESYTNDGVSMTEQEIRDFETSEEALLLSLEGLEISKAYASASTVTFTEE